MVLNPCLPFPKSQDISCVSRWMAEYQSVICKAESDLSIKIQGTEVRAWGKKTGSIFLKFRFQKSFVYSDQGNCGSRLKLMSAFQS